METATAPHTERPAALKAGPEAWCAWVHAHAKPRADWAPGWVWIGFVNVEPPEVPRPAWLLGDLWSKQELILRRVQLPRRTTPGFQVLTGSGRDLGRIAGPSAAMIEFALAEGATPRVSVALSSATDPPEQALMLFLDVMAWFAPDEEKGTPLPYAERVAKP